MGAICNGCHEFVRGSEAGVGDVFVVEVDGVTESFAVGGFDVTAVCTVVFWRGIEVPTIYGVRFLWSLFFHELVHCIPWVRAAFCYSQTGH